jgi:elongation factor G
MKTYQSADIRNIVLVGHAGAGKTMLGESLLVASGAISRMGSIDDGNTVSDFHELEQEKGHSVFSSLLNAEWNEKKLNIIDNPGFDDFIGEVSASVHVGDTAIMVINPSEGVEVGTDLGWNVAKSLGKAVAIIINKCDQDVDFNSVVADLQSEWGNSVTVVQYPVSCGKDFDEIINLISQKSYKFSDGKCTISDIPESEKEKAETLRAELVESIAESDEELMNIYFEEGDLSEDQLRYGLRMAMAKREIFPVMASSATMGVGQDAILDAVVNYFPEPGDMPYLTAEDGREVALSSDGPTVVQLFKMYADPRAGDIVYFKVLSGKIKHSQDLENTSNNHSERIGQISVSRGKDRDEVGMLYAGDIGATVKLKHTHISDTLCQKGLDAILPRIKYPVPKVRVAIEAKNKGEEEKLGTSLNHLHFEDPSLIVEHSSELKQIIVYAQGEQHLTVAKWRMENRYKVEIEYAEPRVPYRETIQKLAKGDYRHKKQSGGAGQFAEVHIMIEPWHEGMADPKGVAIRGRDLHDLPWGGKLEFINSIVGGVIDQRFLPAILKGVMEKMEFGPLTGSYVRDVRVVVFDGKMHSVDSNESAFKTAGMMAFKNTFVEASPKLLEPIYNVSIKIPEEFVGDIMSDLPSRRGMILGIDVEGKKQVVNAKMPLSELDRYAGTLRSMTGSRGTFVSELDGYEPVPQNVAQELISKHNAHDEE